MAYHLESSDLPPAAAPRAEAFQTPDYQGYLDVKALTEETMRLAASAVRGADILSGVYSKAPRTHIEQYADVQRAYAPTVEVPASPDLLVAALGRDLVERRKQAIGTLPPDWRIADE